MGGWMTRPCHMPGNVTSVPQSVFPVTLAAMFGFFSGLPTMVYVDTGLSGGLPSTAQTGKIGCRSRARE